MKKLIILFAFLSVNIINAQAYTGAGDTKFQVGANIQNQGTGIFTSVDFGFGDNISFGVAANYLLSVQDNTLDFTNSLVPTIVQPKFMDRVDVKARFNANIGKVIGLEDNMDVYPGLNLGTRNFGAHLGFRYFLSDGFGLFSEFGIPLAKYKTNRTGFDFYNNQFTLNVGVSFNM